MRIQLSQMDPGRRAAVVALLVATVATVGCTPRPSGDETPAKVEAEAPAHEPPPVDAAGGDLGPSDPSYAVMQKVCASPCTGRFARVHAYRTPDGALGRLRYDGDLEACSHPPQIYFDAEGRETLSVAERPVVPGSDEAEAIAADQAAQLDGLALAETLSCFDADRCEPERGKVLTSKFPCRSDSDCVGCACDPVNRPEWDRRGGAEACNIDGEECIATNPACCAGTCVMAP